MGKIIDLYDCKTSCGENCPYLLEWLNILKKTKFSCKKLEAINKITKYEYGYAAWLFKHCPLKEESKTA